MELTRLFFITYGAALLGVVPPGLINMSVAKTCVEHGKQKGLWVAAGATLIVCLQSLTAIQLARYIFKNPYVTNIFLRTGIVIFLILAIFFFVRAKKAKIKEVKIAHKSSLKSLGKGLGMGVLNVLPIPFFCAIGTGLGVNGSLEFNVLAITLFVLAASLGTFTTLYGYAFFFDKVSKQSQNFSRYSNYFLAALMLVLVLVTFVRTFYS